MQATRQCHVDLDNANHPKMWIKATQDNTQDKTMEKTEHGTEKKTSHFPTPPATPPYESKVETEKSETNASDTKAEPRPADNVRKTTDPLHWYGILVPPQLRHAQSSFVNAIAGPVSDAANATQSMRRNEVEIRKLRKEIKKLEKRAATDK